MNDAKSKTADPSPPPLPEPANGPAVAVPASAASVPTLTASEAVEQQRREDLEAHRREVDRALRGSNEQ